MGVANDIDPCVAQKAFARWKERQEANIQAAARAAARVADPDRAAVKKEEG